MALDDTLVFAAIEAVGLSYGDPATRPAYALHCYPGDSTRDALQMASHQSSCLTHIRGLFAADEVDGQIVWGAARRLIDCLREPYVKYIGLVEALLEQLARQRGLLVTHLDQTALADIRPADVLVHGLGGSAPTNPAERARWLAEWGGVAHGMLVTGVSGRRVEVSQGGQPDPRNPNPKGGLYTTRIDRGERELVKRHNGLWLDSKRLGWRLRAADLPLRRAA